jgi:hypothetical protein
MPKKGQVAVTWTEPGAWVESREFDLKTCVLSTLGEGPYTNRQGLTVLVVEYGPDVQVPSHRHEAPYCSVVVRGEIEITRQWHQPGSIRLVQGGSVYGPLRAGPAGATVIEIFGNGDVTRIPAQRSSISEGETDERDGLA